MCVPLQIDILYCIEKTRKNISFPVTKQIMSNCEMSGMLQFIKAAVYNLIFNWAVSAEHTV